MTAGTRGRWFATAPALAAAALALVAAGVIVRGTSSSGGSPAGLTAPSTVATDSSQELSSRQSGQSAADSDTEALQGRGHPSSSSAATATGGTATTQSIQPADTMVAQAEVDGKAQALRVNTQIPLASPQFTVTAVDATKVTLKLNSGTFPGGSSTIDIAAGASVTLSNPTTGAAVFILVKSIGPIGG